MFLILLRTAHILVVAVRWIFLNYLKYVESNIIQNNIVIQTIRDTIFLIMIRSKNELGTAINSYLNEHLLSNSIQGDVIHKFIE